MKIVVTLGSDTPRPSSGVTPLVKLALTGLVALAVISRKDIRRYFKLRNM